MTFGKIARGGALPRADVGTILEDPLTILVLDGDDIFEEKSELKLKL